MRAATSALPWVLGLAVVSCNAISGIGDLTRAGDDTTTDGGNEGGALCGGADLTSDANNCGTCGHACGTGNYCAASACVQGCTGGLLYVSPSGADTNTGCITAAPLKTISHAVTLAKAQGSALVQEVHVCKGIYKEPQITVDFKSSFRGGYDCTGFKRTATFGFPTFDPTNATEIDSSATTGTSIITVAVGGGAVDASVVLDGFLIHGSSSGSTSIALALNGGSPSIQNDQVVGGTFSEATAAQASIGVQISGGASPEITTSTIDGGGGATTSSATSSIGSVGISITADSGTPNIHGATISGGSGSAIVGDGSIGIAVSGGSFATANAIRQNTISGGTGKIGTSGVASVGIVSVATGNVELDGNQIVGGGGSCATASGTCSSFGIIAGVGNLIVSGNRIYGGDANGSTTSQSGSAGITVSGLKSFVAENNMIHGGNKSGAAAHGSTTGIELTQVTGPQLLNNTIYSGNAGTVLGAQADSIVIEPMVSGIVAQNNLIMTSGNQDAGIAVSCTPELISSFQNNVFLTESAIVSYGGGGTGTCGAFAMSYTQVGGLVGAEGFFSGSATSPTVSGNKSVTLDCGSDSACTTDAVCNSAPNCEAAIVAGWTKADNGFTTLTTDGWKIGTKCAVSQGGVDNPTTLPDGGTNKAASVITDLYGAARTAPLSAGAHEQDATCAP